MEGPPDLDEAPTYTSLTDIKLLSRTSSDAANSTDFAPEIISEGHEGSPQEMNPQISSRDGENKGLSVRFGSIMAMASGLVQKIAELSEKKEASYVSSAEKETIINFFQDRLLELRIWSTDLTACHPSFLEKIDELSSTGGGITHVSSRLSDTFQDISDILIPFTINRNLDEVANPEDHPHSLVDGCFFTTSASSTHPKPCGNISSLGRACDQLLPLFRKLLDQKTAIRGILNIFKDSQGTEGAHTYTGAEGPAAPNVLCFDGGGVRSFSSLLILKNLMERINAKLEDKEPISENRANVQAPLLRPADVFDFMYGSSSGGLLAIMLGRLAMTVDECIQEFERYVKTIFQHPRKITMSGFLRSKYPLSSLTQATRRIISDFDKSTEDVGWRRSIFASPSSKCKVGVVAWDSSKRTTYMFRSYDCVAPDKQRSNTLNPGPADTYKVWQVAMATVAAPTYFDSVNLEGRVFIDGGISTNNPTREAIFDVTALEGGSLREGCVVSIGAGSSSKRTISTRVTKTRKRLLKTLFDAADAILTGTESTHRDVQDLLYQSGTSYSRLTVAHVVDVRLDEWKRISEIYAAANESLRQSEMITMLDNCAAVLAQSIRDRRNSSKGQRFKQIGTQIRGADRISPLSPSKSLGEKGYLVNFSLQGIPFNDKFVERPAEMQQVRSALRSDQDHRRKICVITGLGGIGKTQLAAEYVRRHRDNYSSIFWIHADSQVNIHQDIKDSAHRVYLESQPPWAKDLWLQGSDNPRTLVTTFLAWLSKEDNDSWLLVYDDVNEVNDILEYMPTADHGSILITSRSLDVTSLGTQISLGPMTEDQGAQMLAFAVDDEDRFQNSDMFRTLLDDLGGLPLAIDLAARNIRFMGLSVPEYYTTFQKRKMGIMNVRAGPAQGSHIANLHGTFRTSLEMVKRENYYATKLLQLWAFLDPEQLWFGLLEPALLKQARIPGNWVPQWFQDLGGDKLKFYDLVEVLLRFSMISLGFQKTTYSIHRLLHEWIRDTQEDGTYIENIVLASSVVGLAVSHNARAGSWSEQRRLLPHAITYSHLFSKSIVDEKLSLGKVLNHYKIEERRQDLQEAICYIGRFLIDHEHLEEAATLLYQLIAEIKVLDGQYIPSNFDISTEVGRLKLLQGLFDEAEELLKSALIAKAALRPPNDPLTLIAKSSLALTYLYQERMEESRELIFDILDTIPSIKLDQIDLTLVTALSSMFGFSLARYNDANLVVSCKRALVMLFHLKQYDEASTLTICAALGRLSYLSYTAFDRDELAEARKWFQHASEANQGMNGGNPLAGSEVANNLACVLAKRGRFAEAVSLLRSMLVRAQAMPGKFHPSTRVMMRNLASMKQCSGEVDEAQELIEAARDTEAETRIELALQNMILLPMAKDTAAFEGKK